MGQPAEQYNEVCSNCGEFVSSLNDKTGWCDSCSGVTKCVTCGCPTDSKRCGRCKYLYWLEQNADEIERVMATFGVKASKAKKVVIARNRPICLCCHKPIHRGMKNRDLFCSTKPECIKASTAYNYHKNIQHRSHAESLIRALTAGEIERLTNQIT